MTIIPALTEAAACRINPTFSLFRTDSHGNYTTVLRSKNMAEIDAEFFRECLSSVFEIGTGLEVRCDGIRVFPLN